ncbi:MAG: Diphosphomevalonate decarboxylase [Labilithrix sp.]|nr:Diphosphomevalonate decarboxylase [Labilithrix sp.]
MSGRADGGRTATVLAHPNIALAKYWGKRAGEGNVPAVPSLSVTLAGMTTRTTVSFDDTLVDDELVLDGKDVAGTRAKSRASQLLDRVRTAAGTRTRARIVSANDFPTASGLASSASGFAALALAAVTAAGLTWRVEEIADLARRSSASAARSLFGGFAELDGGDVPTAGDARAVAPGSALDLHVLVCVTTEEAKSTSSTDGMRLTQETSPYYEAWVGDAPSSHRHLREALLAGDFRRVGELAERSALAMHACALGAGILYFTPATLAAIAKVRELRHEGMAVYATVDAGPHVKCLVQRRDVARAREALGAVPGVLRILETVPGDAARVVDEASS